MTITRPLKSERPVSPVSAAAPSIEFPERFQGLFARTQSRFGPLLHQAREVLRALPVPEAVRPYYSYGVLEHAQPSFMLLPMLYLAMADDQGGITARHRDYLPWYMLAMETVAVLDDTVDRTPYRSGRETYARRFGDPSAAPFSCFLLNRVFEGTFATAPEVLPLVTGLFGELCALQTWEYHSRYPEPTTQACARWLKLHYDAVTPAVAHSLNSALALHGLGPVPGEVCVRFGEIMQDVDDVVNFAERRERDGENDDLKMGIVTHLLLATLEAEPSVAGAVAEVWKTYRAVTASAPRDLSAALARCDAQVAEPYAIVASLIERHGLPATVRKIILDADACVRAAPETMRPVVRDMVLTFVDRLRDVDQLHAGLTT